MEQNENKGSISLAELWEVFIGHVWQIVLAALLVLAVFVGYSVFSYQAEYTSTATIYLIRQEELSSSSYSPSNSDFSLALSTVNDCKLLLTSHRVLDQVIDDLGMTISYRKLASMISINNPTNTRYLEVSVTAPTPSDAKTIVDKLCDIGRVSMVDIMGINQVNQVDMGTFSETPSNGMIGMLCYVGALGAAVLVYVIYLIMFMFDDKLGTPEDVEKYLGLSVLGVIPNARDGGGSKYGKYGKYGKGKYGYGYGYGYGQANASREAEGSKK